MLKTKIRTIFVFWKLSGSAKAPLAPRPPPPPLPDEKYFSMLCFHFSSVEKISFKRIYLCNEDS